MVRLHLQNTEQPLEFTYPLVLAKPPELIPLALRHVLSSTRPALSAEVAAIWTSVKKAGEKGYPLRSLHTGDMVTVELPEGVLTWVLMPTGWRAVGRETR